MPGLLADVSRSWNSVLESPSAEQLLNRWFAHEATLVGHRSLRSLTTAARGRGSVELDDRDELLRSLLRLAIFDEDARLAMLHVLAPGLTQIARTYELRWGREETEAMVVAGALERIMAFGDRSDVRPASNIVLGVRHDLFERRLREDTRDRVLGRQVALNDQLPTVVRQTAGEEVLGLVGEGVRTGAITRRGARLILLHRIYGLSTADIASAEGRDAATIRKYRNRAEAALADAAAAVA